ncbi:MAG: alpha/beta hydrolase, partial [Angelakisella sp.]
MGRGGSNMLHEIFSREEISHALPGSATALRLTSYARPRSGLLGDDGDRWAVLILPGGGYELTSPTEGEPVALAFVAAGVQAFVLDYSVAPDVWPQAFLETAAAVAFLRKRAERYGFSPDKIAVCGFSAGGHLAGSLANLWQHAVIGQVLGVSPRQVRPDAAILCYPVISADCDASGSIRRLVDG